MTFILEAKDSGDKLVSLATCEDANNVTVVAQRMLAISGVANINIARADRPDDVREKIEQPVTAAPTVDAPVASTTDSKSKNGG